MPIRVPVERCYYPSHPTEPYYILAWIPQDELRQKVELDGAKKELLKYYPNGLVLQLNTESVNRLKKQYNLDLGIDIDKIRNTYQKAFKKKILPIDGTVQAKSLELYAKTGVSDDKLNSPKFGLRKEAATVFEMILQNQKEEKTADLSSVIRVLNSFGAEIRQSGETTFFKTKKRSLVKDLESFAASYKPLIDLELHDCGDKYCSIHHYYILRMHINPNIHAEAANKLYKVLEKYEKRSRKS